MGPAGGQNSSPAFLGHPELRVLVAEGPEGAGRLHGACAESGGDEVVHDRLAFPGGAPDHSVAIPAGYGLGVAEPLGYASGQVVAPRALGHPDVDVAPPAAYRLDDHAAARGPSDLTFPADTGSVFRPF